MSGRLLLPEQGVPHRHSRASVRRREYSESCPITEGFHEPLCSLCVSPGRSSLRHQDVVVVPLVHNLLSSPFPTVLLLPSDIRLQSLQVGSSTLSLVLLVVFPSRTVLIDSDTFRSLPVRPSPLQFVRGTLEPFLYPPHAKRRRRLHVITKGRGEEFTLEVLKSRKE